MKDNTALFLFAMQFYGTKAILGKEHNPVILEWFRKIGHAWVDNDETAWCSCFMNYVAMEMGLERTGRLDARSWLKIGEEIKLSDAQIGDVIVFWRESLHSWKGHVGLYAGQDLHSVFSLSGNQDKQVNIKPYPRSRLLGVRRLKRIKF